jgi:sterol desaturase/sphingolipid hydroxylase (fatty acid hydroxylase superfamily)
MIPGWISMTIAGGTLAGLSLLERLRPLRRRVEPSRVHLARNLVIGALGAAVLSVADRPVTAVVARYVDTHQLGLVPPLRLPPIWEMLLALVLLDYTIFLWHMLMHRLPLLWRLHAVHHTDLDVDASTALRFHPGELVVSVAMRSAQVLLIGVRPETLAAWHSLLFVSVLFHHSNLRLPAGFERALGLVFMTPRLHGIHHSVVGEETNSNYSSGLMLWDMLHRTRKSDVPQEQITIGVADYRDPGLLSLGKLLVMPAKPRG